MRSPRALAAQAWRTTGSFVFAAVFSVITGFLAFTVLPWWRARLPRDRAREKTQRLFHDGLRRWLATAHALGLIDITVHGREHLDTPGAVIAANHPTLIDALLLISRLPAVDCIVKDGLWRLAWLKPALDAADYIPNTGGRALFGACAARLQAGRRLLVFPEGTRSTPFAPLDIPEAGALIAVRARAPIVPVTIACSTRLLTKGQSWIAPPREKPRFVLTVHPPIDTVAARAAAGGHAGAAARALTARLAALFEAARGDKPPMAGAAIEAVTEAGAATGATLDDPGARSAPR